MSSRKNLDFTNLQSGVDEIKGMIEAKARQKREDEEREIQSLLDFIDNLNEELDEEQEEQEELGIAQAIEYATPAEKTVKLRVNAPYQYQQISTGYENEDKKKELWFFSTDNNNNTFIIDQKKILFMEHFDVSKTENVKPEMSPRDIFEVWGPLTFFVAFAYLLGIYLAIPTLIVGGLLIHWIGNRKVKRTTRTRMIKLCFKTNSTYDSIVVPASQVEVTE